MSQPHNWPDRNQVEMDCIDMGAEGHHGKADRMIRLMEQRDDARDCLRELTGRIQSVREQFEHIDRVLRECATSDDPIYRAASALWVAVADAHEDNATPPQKLPRLRTVGRKGTVDVYRR
jgi:hypothetical protein